LTQDSFTTLSLPPGVITGTDSANTDRYYYKAVSGIPVVNDNL
jgi:hypothetical protein